MKLRIKFFSYEKIQTPLLLDLARNNIERINTQYHSTFSDNFCISPVFKVSTRKNSDGWMLLLKEGDRVVKTIAYLNCHPF